MGDDDVRRKMFSTLNTLSNSSSEITSFTEGNGSPCNREFADCFSNICFQTSEKETDRRKKKSRHVYCQS